MTLPAPLSPSQADETAMSPNAPHSGPAGLRLLPSGQSVLRLVERSTEARTPAPRRTLEKPPAAPRQASPPVRQATVQWDELLGTTIDRFRLDTKLYADEVCGTFSARHTRLDFQAVVRVLHLDAATPAPALVEFLIQQAHAMARIRHPHVTRMLACTTYQRFLVIVSEFVAGMSLAERLTHARMLPEAQALVIAQQVAEGLQGGLQHGFCHGGVCPMHIRVTAQNKAKLVDYCWHMPHDLFAARHPHDSPPPQDLVSAALRPYRAPESQHTAAGNHRADIYALGATLYHLLTGQPHAQVGSIVERLHGASRPADVLTLHHVNPHVSHATSELVTAMLAHDPAQRLPDYRSVLTKLEACILGLRIHQARP